MRLFFLTLLVFLLSSNFVYGQVSIQIDGSDPMPADDVKSILIDENGNMVITSQNGDYLLAKDDRQRGVVSINSFRIDNALSADIAKAGDSAAMTWSTSNAASCVARTRVIQGNSSDLADWSAATSIGTASYPSNPVTVQFPENGEYRLFLKCEDVNGLSAEKFVTAKVGAISLEFTVSSDPAEPQSGDNVRFTLEWSAPNADSCYGSWTDDPLEDVTNSGTETVVVSNIQPGVEYSISCMNLIDEVEKTIPIDISDPAPSCNVTLTSKLIRPWTSSFGTMFPGPNFSRIGFAAVPPTGYTSYEFEVGDIEDEGFVATFQANGTSGARIISISEVPGCFEVEDKKCKASLRDTSIEWDTTGTSNTACQLKKGKTYYWNITFTDGKDPFNSRCTADCYAGLVVNNPDYGN